MVADFIPSYNSPAGPLATSVEGERFRSDDYSPTEDPAPRLGLRGITILCFRLWRRKLMYNFTKIRGNPFHARTFKVLSVGFNPGILGVKGCGVFMDSSVWNPFTRPHSREGCRGVLLSCRQD